MYLSLKEYVDVCVYLWMYVYMHECMYLRIYASTYRSMYACMYVFKINVNKHGDTQSHDHMYVA